jgi:hypothetical protein
VKPLGKFFLNLNNCTIYFRRKKKKKKKKENVTKDRVDK